jgi:cerevisin
MLFETKTTIPPSMHFLGWIGLTLLTLVAVISARDQTSDYVVIFHKSEQVLHARNHHNSWILSVTKRGDSIKGHFNIGDKVAGYHGSFTDHEIDQIRNSSEVALVEPDSLDTAQTTTIIQQNAPWGLARISHRNNPINADADNVYMFNNLSGFDTTIYILDTGVRGTHDEFSGRFRYGANFVDDADGDGAGHGTHVAGIAAGSSVGVSKNANIVSVKILDKNKVGSISKFVKGVSWIIDDVKRNGGSHHAVINYSAVGRLSEARNVAIGAAIDAGILFVGPSGNRGTDACGVGPCNYNPREGMLVVAALNFTDEPASFTNYGPCVDVYAPGVNITSSIDTSDDAYVMMSGSSMASPYVAGLASYYWSLNNSYSMKDISDLITNSNTGLVTGNLPNTVNKIAFNGAEQANGIIIR